MAIDFPDSPVVGQVYSGFRWDGDKWTITRATFNQGDVVTGANITAEDSDAYYYGFTANGTVTFTAGAMIDAVWIGGGGGGTTGGWRSGGGAGAGGMLALQNYAMPAGSYAVVIGGGGATGNPRGTNGGNTTWLSAQADGGAGGEAERQDGQNGGCGSGTFQSYNGGEKTQIDRLVSTGGTATGYGNDGAFAGNPSWLLGQAVSGGGGVGSAGFFGLGATRTAIGSPLNSKFGNRGGYGTEVLPEFAWLGLAGFGENGAIGGGGGGGSAANFDYGFMPTGASAGGAAGGSDAPTAAAVENTGGGGGGHASGGQTGSTGGSGALYIRVRKAVTI